MLRDEHIANMNSQFNVSRYMICTKPRPEHLIGGAIAVEISANICTTLSFNHQGGNPSIEFPADRQPNVLVSIEDDEATPIDQQYILGAVPSVQELLVVMDLADAACSVIGEPGNPANQVVAFYKGEYWIHDPRFVSQIVSPFVAYRSVVSRYHIVCASHHSLDHAFSHYNGKGNI